jgi:ribose-phosphate pyrophosphokinase
MSARTAARGASPAGPEPAVRILAGTAHPALGEAVARELGAQPLPHRLERTPDGELLVRIDESARGRAVAIVQPTAAPVGEHLLDLLLLADGCWRLGAQRVTAVIPYLGYSRQDRRTEPGESLGARVVAQVLAGAHLDRVVVVDPHNPAVESGFACPLEQLSAVSLLARAVERHVGKPHGTDCVIVAPDLGATKLAQRYAKLLGWPVAIVHKERLGPREVVAERIIGDVRGLTPVIVDDIVSTAGTISAAVTLLAARGAKLPVVVVATHGLFTGPAVDRLRALPLARVVTTDSVPQPAGLPFAHDVVPLAPILAEAIRRVSGRFPRESLKTVRATEK